MRGSQTAALTLKAYIPFMGCFKSCYVINTNHPLIRFTLSYVLKLLCIVSKEYAFLPHKYVKITFYNHFLIPTFYPLI